MTILICLLAVAVVALSANYTIRTLGELPMAPFATPRDFDYGETVRLRYATA